jgi:ABC-type sugar transport system ATPase subunit
MNATEPHTQPLLELRGICKRFAGTIALDRINFALRRGEIHAVLGENGAGKSTLIKIITGAIRPDAGELRVQGQYLSHLTPRDASAFGITSLPQDVVAVPDLSVGRNVLLGLEGAGAKVDSLTATEAGRVQWALRQVGSTISPKVKAKELSTPDLRLVQIARTMLHVGNIVVMDEPTAVLSETEADNLLSHLVSFRNRGKGIVYVTHRLSEVMRIADRATILRDGLHVALLERDAFDRNQIVELMARVTAERSRSIGLKNESTLPDIEMPSVAAPAIDVVDLTLKDRFSEITFSADSGKIVGIAGVQGSGHADILRAMAGVAPRLSGRICVFGRPLQPGSTTAAFEQGIVLVPADRRRSVILTQMSVQENLAVSRRVRHSCRRFGFRSIAKERLMTLHHINALSIVPPRSQALAGVLSGGNQQKVALARALEGNAKILLMDEPTQGIDVRSKAEIHALIRRTAVEGCSIIIASSEFEELVELADVIHVMRLGRLRRTFLRGDMDYREILHCALP